MAYRVNFVRKPRARILPNKAQETRPVYHPGITRQGIRHFPNTRRAGELRGARPSAKAGGVALVKYLAEHGGYDFPLADAGTGRT